MADNSVGGLNIRIGADISEGERQVQKFVREFDTALKELSMGRRGGMYTTSAFRNAVEREQARAQEEFARGGVFGESGQDINRAAFREVLMRGSGYAQLVREEQAAAEKRQKINELVELSRQASLDKNAALSREYWQQIMLLTETESEKRIRLAKEVAEATVRINQEKLDAIANQEQKAANQFASMQAEQLTRMRNLPRDPMTGDVNPQLAFSYMLRRAGETSTADAVERGVRERQKAAEKQMAIDDQIALHRQAKHEAALAKNAQLEAAHVRMINELQESDHEKDMARVRKRGADEAAAELQRQRHVYEQKKKLDSMPATERKILRLRESGEFEEADRLEQKYLRLQKVMGEVNAPLRERAALVERLAVLAELEAAATKRGNAEAVERIKIDRQRTTDRLTQIDSPAAIDEVGAAANKARYAVMNLAYGVQDAVTVFGTSGFAGAVRASANNLVALGTLMDQSVLKSGGIGKALREPEVLMIGAVAVIQVVTGLIERYQSLEESARKARNAMIESMQMDLSQRADFATRAVTAKQATRQADEEGYEALVKLREERERHIEVLEAEVKANEAQFNDVQAKRVSIMTELALLKQQENLPERGLSGMGKLADSTVAWWRSFTQSADQRDLTVGEQLQTLEDALKMQHELEGKARSEREKSKTLLFEMLRLVQEAAELEGKAATRKLERERREKEEQAKKKAEEEAAERARQDAADLNEARWMDFKEKRDQDRRVSDIAITQAERILSSREQKLQQMRQQAGSGPQLASMVAFGSQEDVSARARVRAGTATIDPMLEEAKKQVRQAEEIVRELRMIREEMQPGYMVETFKP